MPTNRDLRDFLYTLAPPELAESWDNHGLLCGHLDRPVRKVLVALDPFLSVAEEAAAWGADLIVTHHPLIYRPATSVTDGTPVGRALLCLIEHGIAAINVHTCLDAAPGGVNDVLAAALGLSDVTAQGYCRFGSVPAQPLHGFAAQVKSALHTPAVRVADAGRPVQRVAVCGGAGLEFLPDVVAAGCDTFVTGDVKYNGFWDAVDLGVNLIDAGHFPTENPVCAALAERIQARFPELEVRVSASHRDVVEFV